MAEGWFELTQNKGGIIVNHLQTGANQRGQRQCRILMTAGLLLAAWPALAEVDVTASAIARYEYDSNVFDLQNGFPVPGTTNDFARSDKLYTYGAALDTAYLWDQQKLFGTFTANRFEYDRFTELNHLEYTADGGLNWKLGSNLDGTLEALRDRTMVAFTNVNNAQFVLQTEQKENAKFGVEFIPDWRFEGSGYYRTVDQNYVGALGLNLSESQGQVALRYLGLAGLTGGLSFAYTDGRYSGAEAQFNPAYEQNSVSFISTYAPTGRSTFQGALGYSDRRSGAANNSISGVTGELDYDNQITGKTSAHFAVSRLINSYISNTSSEIDSVASGTLRWQTTYRLGLAAGYTYTYRDLPGQGNAPLGSNRIDHLQYATLNVDFEPFRWLSLKPYANYQVRKSNFVSGNFNATIVGLNFTVKWQKPPPLGPRIQRPAEDAPAGDQAP
jgi:hypothetical protein